MDDSLIVTNSSGPASLSDPVEPSGTAADSRSERRSQAIGGVQTSAPPATQVIDLDEPLVYSEEFHITGSERFPAGFVEIVRKTGPSQTTSYICFNQLKAHYFKYLPRGTLSGWVHKLEIEKLKCTEKEQAILKSVVPEERGKPFYLLTTENALLLVQHHRDRLRDLNARATTYRGYHVQATRTSPGPAPSKLRCTSPAGPSPPRRTLPPCGSAPAAISTFGELEHQVDSQSGDSEDEDAATPAQVSSSAGPVKPGKAHKVLHTISEEDMTSSLRKDFDGFATFYGEAFESRRRGPSLSHLTLQKVTERLKMFMYYVKFCRKLEPGFSQLRDSVSIEAYTNFLRDARSLKPVTISRHLYALEKGLLFFLRDSPAWEREQSPALAAIRNVSNQCDKVARIEKMNQREGVNCKPRQNLVYAEILELCKELRSSFEEESSSLKKARAIHDLVLMLIYLYFVPRAHEVRTLVLEKDFPAGEVVPVGPQRQNVIVFYDDGSVELILTKYKTDKCYGPCKVPVAYDSPLSYYLKRYSYQFREKLLIGTDHSAMFLNCRGQEFSSSASFSKYLCQIIEKGTGKRGSTNSLRHAIATKFVADPELCENAAFRESLCRVMRHSRETQDKCYNDNTNAAKSEQALGVLSESVGREIFGDSCMPVGHQSNTANPASDEEGVEAQPCAGDIVALVEPSSTRENPVVFIAKIIRFTGSRDEAVLAEFEEEEEGCYRLKIQSYRPWVEALDSLVWPIDIAYDSQARAYKLRSLKQEIHDSVLQSPAKRRRMK